MAKKPKPEITLEDLEKARILLRRSFPVLFAVPTIGLPLGLYLEFSQISDFNIDGIGLGGFVLIITILVFIVLVWKVAYKTGRLLKNNSLFYQVLVFPILVGILPTSLAVAAKDSGYRMGFMLGKFKTLEDKE